jgi:acetyl-CoA C-acetyltransferase
LEAYIYDGVRSPFGRHGGALSGIRPDDLLAQLLNELQRRNGFKPDSIEDVIIGCANQAGEDSRNVARNALLAADFPVTVGGQTVNRLCASGLEAVIQAARAIHAGEGDLFIAGGVESMSRAPYVMSKPSTAYGRDSQMFDSTIGARFPNKKVLKQFGAETMPETGDNVARMCNITREAADAFAVQSQQRYEAFKQSAQLAAEVANIQVGDIEVKADEHPRANTSVEKLAAMKPLFKDGVVTAGNATGINDGAAVLLLGSKDVGKLGLVSSQPIARIVSTAVVGVEPKHMGLGPVGAILRALNRAKLKLDDMDIIEINEAFASQVLACAKSLNIAFDDPRLNPNGGAIAVGHPLGASGARLVLTAVNRLKHMKQRYAVVSLCIGMGQGLAIILENVS